MLKSRYSWMTLHLTQVDRTSPILPLNYLWPLIYLTYDANTTSSHSIRKILNHSISVQQGGIVSQTTSPSLPQHQQLSGRYMNLKVYFGIFQDKNLTSENHIRMIGEKICTRMHTQKKQMDSDKKRCITLVQNIYLTRSEPGRPLLQKRESKYPEITTNFAKQGLKDNIS